METTSMSFNTVETRYICSALAGAIMREDLSKHDRQVLIDLKDRFKFEHNMMKLKEPKEEEIKDVEEVERIISGVIDMAYRVGYARAFKNEKNYKEWIERVTEYALLEMFKEDLDEEEG